YYQPPGLAHRGKNRRIVAGNERSQIDDLGLDTIPLERASRLHGVEGRIGRGNDRHVGAFRDHPRLAEWDRVVAFGNRSVDVVKPAMFEEHHRIVVLDASDKQPFGVVRRRGHDDLEPRNMRKPSMQTLGMLRTLAPAAADDHSYRHRYLGLAAKHVMPLRGLI